MLTDFIEKRVALTTLGCKLNYAETSTIARKFQDQGFKKVRFGEEADIVVINTCSVTQQADRKCKLAIKKAIKSSPSAFVAVIGCYSQLKSEEISSIKGVDLVLGTKEKFRILEYIGKLDKHEYPEIYSCGIDAVSGFESSYSMSDRTRAFLKVQDGCDFHCSYCTIPMARGKSRNPTIEQVVAEAKEIGKQGIKEVVLTGVNIADFGKSTGETFFELIRQLDLIKDIGQFRISSIEPNLITDEIIQFVADSKHFAPHFHMPLQSGCNEILGLMGRRYKRDLFANQVKTIKTIMPHACIGADVIVGFPGETDGHFLDTFNFLKDTDISYLHVFSYSERQNTRAINLPGKVMTKEKDSRSRILIELSERKRTLFYQENIGKEYMVLFESQQSKGQMFGFTSNYVKVETKFNKSLINKVVNVKFSGLLPSGNVDIIY